MVLTTHLLIPLHPERLRIIPLRTYVCCLIRMSKVPSTISMASQLYDYVRFTFVDLGGCPRGKTLPAHCVDDALENGMGTLADLTTPGPLSKQMEVEEIEKISHGNMLLKARSPVYPLPWAGNNKYKIGEVLCEPELVDGKSYFPSTRTAARNQLAKLREEGYQLVSGMEMEFILEDKTSGNPVYCGSKLYENEIVSKFGNILFPAEKYFHKMGIVTTAIHAEWCPGQFEFALQEKAGIQAVDHACIFKHGMKEMALQHGMLANFMFRPSLQSVSDCQFSHSLWSDDLETNVFFDTDGDLNLSDAAYHWLAGLCAHGPALVALTNPTTNAYRREGLCKYPTVFNWGIDNRKVAYRIQNHTPKGCRMEVRYSAACNPYLTLAGVVAAGLDGLKNKLPCPEEYVLSAPQLPKTLPEALEALENDKIIKEALGENLIRWFVESKRQVDLKFMEGYDLGQNDTTAIKKERELYANCA